MATKKSSGLSLVDRYDLFDDLVNRRPRMTDAQVRDYLDREQTRLATPQSGGIQLLSDSQGGAATEVEQQIKRAAISAGATDLIPLLLAIGRKESGLNPNAPGDYDK